MLIHFPLSQREQPFEKMPLAGFTCHMNIAVDCYIGSLLNLLAYWATMNNFSFFFF